MVSPVNFANAGLEGRVRKMINDIIVRKIVETDYPLLEDFLYHAVFLPPGIEPPPKDIIFKPEIHIYIKDFGGENDCRIVAEYDGKVVGAAWTRIIPAYGHIDDKTPELAVSVLPEYRGRGIGTALITRLFELLRERGYKLTSLSVQKENPAARLYRRFGYEIIRENDEDYIMVKKLGIAVRIITDNKKDFLPLLLLGDEQESEIDKYLERGELFVLYDGVLISVYAMTDEGDGIIEIQNLATDEKFQKQSYASWLIEYVCDYYAGRYNKVILGTSSGDFIVLSKARF